MPRVPLSFRLRIVDPVKVVKRYYTERKGNYCNGGQTAQTYRHLHSSPGDCRRQDPWSGSAAWEAGGLFACDLPGSTESADQRPSLLRDKFWSCENSDDECYCTKLHKTKMLWQGHRMLQNYRILQNFQFLSRHIVKKKKKSTTR